MKNLLKLIVSCAFFLGFSSTGKAQTVQVIKFRELLEIRNNPSDTLYIVNFWATWCKPCIQELPFFEAASARFRNQPVKIILISLDSKRDLETRVIPFVRKRKLQSKLFLLDEPDANSWIDKLEPQWSGAIPATIFFNNQNHIYRFEEKEFHEAELNALIEKLNAKNK